MVNIDIFKYSIFASSYIISSLSEQEIKRLESVLLFGSVASGTANENSDIDLFFNVDLAKKQQLFLRAKLNKAAENFYLTNTALEFKVKGIENSISIKVGKLEEWEDLSQNISSNGIVLYKKYTGKPTGLKAYTLLSWEKSGKSKGAVLNKFYGYRIGKKFYPGLLQKTKSEKIGMSSVMIPASSSRLFIEVLEKYKINYSRRDVWSA